MALFPVTSNPSGRLAAILENFEWPYLRNGSFDPLIYRCSAHRAVIFAIAQLSCTALIVFVLFSLYDLYSLSFSHSTTDFSRPYLYGRACATVAVIVCAFTLFMC